LKNLTMCKENRVTVEAQAYGKEEITGGEKVRTLVYQLPGFTGYSALANRQRTQAEDMQNFTVREDSLKPRNGSAVQIAATSAVIESLFLFTTKTGVKYFLGAEGTNLWVGNLAFTAWVTPAIKTDCGNAVFCNDTFLNKSYMSNGTDMLSYDGTTLAAISGPPITFDVIASWQARVWTNDTTEPTYLRYSDVGNAGTISDHYVQISENTGDGIKQIIPLLNQLVIINEFSAYKYLGSSASNFTKVPIGPVGTVSGRSVVNINESIYFLSQDGVYFYGGGKVHPVAFDLGEFTDLVNIDYLDNAVAVAYKSSYLLAIAGTGSITNNLVFEYDTLTGRWTKHVYAFSIYDFCLDGDELYCSASDKKIYLLDVGSKDDSAAITYRWISDALDLGKPGIKKKVKNIAVELGNVTGGGTLSLYLKEDDGLYSSAYSITIPSASPGATKVIKVSTNKFYNLTVKLQTTVQAEIMNLTFGGKSKTKVK